jgi:predicted amidohydrolase
VGKTRYGLFLKGGKAVGPASKVDAICDLAVESGRIAAVDADISAQCVARAIDLRGRTLVSGLASTHP